MWCEMELYKLAKSEFTWERWGGRYFGLNEVFDFESGILNKKRFDFVGYILSKDLHVRPRRLGKAVMLFDKEDNLKYWIHFPTNAENIQVDFV